MPQSANAGIVCIVDDEVETIGFLEKLFAEASIRTKIFHDGFDFLAYCRTHSDSSLACLIVDMIMPHITGIEVMEETRKLGIEIPTIMISNHGDVAGAVQAMRLGAIDFIQKPFSPQSIIYRVHEAFQISRKLRARQALYSEIMTRARSLTARERQILDCIADGHSTKEVAAAMGITTNTVDTHRAHIMRKMNVQSPEQLILAGLRLQRKLPCD